MASLLDTPDILETEGQEAFNLAVWEKVLGDAFLRGLPHRIETNRFGEVIMSPPPTPEHGSEQIKIGALLNQLLPHGDAVGVCAVSTSDGVKGIDVGWMSATCWQTQQGKTCLTKAPEICIEIVSRNNSRRELREKKALYFEAGAEEVWFHERDGRMAFYLKAAPEDVAERSVICPEFPPIFGAKRNA